MPEISSIRNPLDEKKLEAYLTDVPNSVTLGIRLPQFLPPFTVNQFTFGQSNPTYLIEDKSGSKYVLRRKPTSNSKLVSKSAHAIEREFFMLKGIAKCNEAVCNEKRVPVPAVYLLCEDESVLGVVFYVMEYVEGRAIKQPEMSEIPLREHTIYWNSIMKTISSIHSIDCEVLIKYLPAKHFPQFQPEKLHNRDDAAPTYFQRQVRTLRAVESSQAKTVDSIPGFDSLINWILSHAPKDPSKLTLVHGDCKIDNFLFHPLEPKVVAVLDWELCTLGHPMFDLANFLQPYIFPKQLNQAFSPGSTIGVEDSTSAIHVQEVLIMYEKLLGDVWRQNDQKNNPRDLWKLGSVFGLLRLCVISQGVAMRLAKGTASSASAAAVAGLYKSLSPLALGLIDDGVKL